jgi:hypothetical protein
MANKNTKFKDLKKGDHLYWVGVDHKNFQPIFCEYELIDDMKFTGPDKYEYECHIIPVNYNPKIDYWCGPNWDGTPQRFWPGISWNDIGKDHQMTTCLEYAEKYYKDMYKQSIEYLQKDYDKILKLLNYHKAQLENFDFYKKL